MSTTDPFLAASPIYRAAIRHPHKSGAALQVFRPRVGWSLFKLASVSIVLWVLLSSGAREVLWALGRVG